MTIFGIAIFRQKTNEIANYRVCKRRMPRYYQPQIRISRHPHYYDPVDRQIEELLI